MNLNLLSNFISTVENLKEVREDAIYSNKHLVITAVNTTIPKV